MKATRWIILVAAVALLVAACGDDGGGETGANPTTGAASDVVPDPDELAEDPEGVAEELA